MKFLVWLYIIIILGVEDLPFLALGTLSTTKDRGSVLSKPHLQEREANGVNATTSLRGGNDREVSVLKAHQGKGSGGNDREVSVSKAHQGKGGHGGANIDTRPRSPEKSAASGPKRSLFFILSPTILCTGFSWILLFPF